MKKLLSFLVAVSITATSTTTVIACNKAINKNEAKLGETYEIGEIDNIFPETIFKATESMFTNLNSNDYEVYSYDQTSALLVQKKSIATSTNFNPITVTFKIKTVEFSEDNTDLKLNILVGNMDEFGIINQKLSIAKVMQDKLITMNSIRTSFAEMNGIYLNESDIEIGEVNYETKTVEITSLNQDILKGNKMTISLNANVSSYDLLRVTEVGTIYLPGTMWDKRDEFFNPEVNDGLLHSLLVTYPMVFQNVGDKNKLFAYLAEDLTTLAGYILNEIAGKQHENMGNGWVNINLSWGGIDNALVTQGFFSSDSLTTKISFDLAQEKRIILGNFIPEEIVVSESVFALKNPELIKTEIYNQLDAEYKSKISLEIFKKYTTIHFVANPTIEVLPGGDWMFGLNRAALLLGALIYGIKLEEYNPPVYGATPGHRFFVR